MAREILRAEKTGQHYARDYLTTTGKKRFPKLLARAARRHDEQWLATALRAGDLMSSRAPANGEHVIAEQHFIRFYMIAVCVQALEDGREHVTFYRAKERGQPRPESKAIEGRSVRAELLMQVLRDLEAAERCEFWKPNSGLAVE